MFSSRRPLQLEQILRQQDADDVLALALVHRKARVGGVDDEVQQFVVGRVDVEHIHARGGHHHVARGHVGDADHAFEHDARFGVDDVVVLGLGEGFDQLVLGVRPGWMNSASFCRKPRLSACRRLRCGPLLGGDSATERRGRL
jgi:hypothetical protein